MLDEFYSRLLEGGEVLLAGQLSKALYAGGVDRALAADYLASAWLTPEDAPAWCCCDAGSAPAAGAPAIEVTTAHALTAAAAKGGHALLLGVPTLQRGHGLLNDGR